MVLKYICESKVGRLRDQNEDYAEVFQLEEGLLAIVCDGLGGNNAGEIASELAVATIFDSFVNIPGYDFIERIHHALLTANDVLLQTAREDSELRGMATTAEVLFISGSTAYWGHVGDSRIYYFGDDEFVQITKDHSLVQNLIDDGLINQSSAENHPQRNVVTRALGNKRDLMVDLGKIELAEVEHWKFLLCTDGVSTTMDNDELDELLEYDDLHQIIVKMTNMVERRGAPDNYSYIVISNRDY